MLGSASQLDPYKPLCLDAQSLLPSAYQMERAPSTEK